MPTFTTLKPPTSGTAITRKNGRLVVPDNPIIPFIEGDGTGRTSGARACACSTRRSQKAYGGKKQDRVDGSLAGEKSFKQFNNWLPDDTVEAFREYLRRHQGPADDAGRRRHPLAERRAAADARPLRLPAPGALVQGRALAGEASRKGRHGDLPREHGRHLRRHRVRGRHARSAEDPRLLRQGVPEGVQEDPLRHRRRRRRTGRRQLEEIGAPKRDVGVAGRHRHQADQLPRHRAAGAQRHQLRDRQQSARA